MTTIATTAPLGFDVSGAEWFLVRGAGSKPDNVQVAAVWRPGTAGPFPVVVYLHGAGGLARWMVQWNARLAAAGFVVVAGCWNFVSAEPTRPVMPCPRNLAPDEDAIAALMEAGRTLPGANRDMVGLFGISAGGVEALKIARSRPEIKAVAVDSPGPPSSYRPARIPSPVLILGGTADGDVSMRDLQQFEQELARTGTMVEARYDPGGRHVVTAFPETSDDATARTVRFFTKYLKP